MFDFDVAAPVGDPKSGSAEVGESAFVEGNIRRVCDSKSGGFWVAGIFVLALSGATLMKCSLNASRTTGREFVATVLEGEVVEFDVLAIDHGNEGFDLWGDEGQRVGILAFPGEVAEDACFCVEMPFARSVEEGVVVFEMEARLLFEVGHRVVRGGRLTDGVTEKGLLVLGVDGLVVHP